MGLAKEQAWGSLRTPPPRKADLPGTLGKGAHLLGHQPQPPGDSWTKTPFPRVSLNDLGDSRNTFGRTALELPQDPAPHNTTMTSLLDQVT